MMNEILEIEKKQIVKSDPMVPFLMKIRKTSWETNDIFSLVLEHDGDNKKTFSFKPGQFNMVYAFGQGEAAISISSDSSKDTSITHTIHKVGYVTSALSQLKKGDVIGIRGPFGSSWPVEEAKGKDVVIVTGRNRACAAKARNILYFQTPQELRQDNFALWRKNGARPVVQSRT